jgi:3-oxoadipate enol-lactonase
MYVRELGETSRRPVLLLHGQMLDGSVFDPLASELARTRQVLVPDLPGYGRTARLARWSFEAVRQAIEADLAARRIDSIDVLGYSLGAYHALAVALAERVQVNRLYLLGAMPGADAGVLATFAAYAAQLRAGTLDLADASLDLAVPEPWAAAHPAEIAAARSAIRRTPIESVAAELEVFPAMSDLRPRLGELECEVLLRVGSEDRNTPADWSRAMARSMPGARLEIAPGVGHLYLTQDREGTVASAVAFLR